MMSLRGCEDKDEKKYFVLNSNITDRGDIRGD